MLDCYRRLGRLRRELPQLTDPSFGSVSCTVEGRLFTMRRGDLLVVGQRRRGRPSTLEVGEREVLFATPCRASTRDGGVLSVPAHAGALLGPVATFS